MDEARAICQQYVDEASWCFSLTATEFIYKNGNESGCVVGLIYYPRFPTSNATIREHALAIGEQLRQAFGQFRVSVCFPDETIMLGETLAEDGM